MGIKRKPPKDNLDEVKNLEKEPIIEPPLGYTLEEQRRDEARAQASGETTLKKIERQPNSIRWKPIATGFAVMLAILCVFMRLGSQSPPSPQDDPPGPVPKLAVSMGDKRTDWGWDDKSKHRVPYYLEIAWHIENLSPYFISDWLCEVEFIDSWGKQVERSSLAGSIKPMSSITVRSHVSGHEKIQRIWKWRLVPEDYRGMHIQLEEGKDIRVRGEIMER